MKFMFVSIIIPVLNEEKTIKILLLQLQKYRHQGHEVVVVDGGSKDQTMSASTPFADKIILSEKGRSSQMNSGATASAHEILWFLHADTLVPSASIEHIQQALTKRCWGHFNVKLSGSHFFFRLIEKTLNIRSRLTGIATGDQGIFVKKSIFNSVKGYSDIPLMEDIDLSKKLNKISKPMCVKETLITSSRRWEEKGVFTTILLMWKLRFLFWLGVSAEKLAAQYK